MKLTIEFEEDELPKLAFVFSCLDLSRGMDSAVRKSPESPVVPVVDPEPAPTVHVDEIVVSVESAKDTITEDEQPKESVAEVPVEETPMEYEEFQKIVMSHVTRLGDAGSKKIAAYLDSEFGTKSAKQLDPSRRRAAIAGIEKLA